MAGLVLVVGAGSSGRRPRRPRIATPPRDRALPRSGRAAAAVRGGRGSQLYLPDVVAEDSWEQRPPSAAAEDRNLQRQKDADVLTHAAAAVRGGRGSQRERTAQIGAAVEAAAAVRGGRGSQPRAAAGHRAGRARGQRPPSAAAEDRNCGWVATPAADLCSGRRPRRPRIATRGTRPTCAGPRSSSGRRPRRPRIATGYGPAELTELLYRSGRRPRRPRIATSATAATSPADTWQRPPSAAAEDRNSGTGRPALPARSGSGRRPRRPRIATL